MSKKISLGVAATIALIAMAVTFSLTMVISMNMFNSTVSSGISFCVSVVVNYILSVTVVFDADREANKAKQFTVFLILSVIGLGINTLIMWAGTGILDQYMERSYMLVKIFATAVVMVYNFITRKIFIEKKD